MAETSLQNLFGQYSDGKKFGPKAEVGPAEPAKTDWLDQDAVLQRNHSTKGFFYDPKLSASKRVFPSTLTNSKSCIIHLTHPPDSGQYSCSARRSIRSSSSRFFSKPFSNQAQARSLPESPKVSCTGRVKPKENAAVGLERQRATEKSSSDGKSAKGKSKFWAKFSPVFTCQDKSAARSPEKRKLGNESTKLSQIPAVEPQAPAPGLVGMKNFASARRPDTWLD